MLVSLLLVVLAVAVTAEMTRRSLAGRHFESALRLAAEPASPTHD
jgi:hypothetical protein